MHHQQTYQRGTLSMYRLCSLSVNVFLFPTKPWWSCPFHWKKNKVFITVQILTWRNAQTVGKSACLRRQISVSCAEVDPGHVQQNSAQSLEAGRLLRVCPSNMNSNLHDFSCWLDMLKQNNRNPPLHWEYREHKQNSPQNVGLFL